MHEALCRPSGTTLDILHAEGGPPITQRTSGLGRAYNHFEILETLANPFGLLGRAALRQMEPRLAAAAKRTRRHPDDDFRCAAPAGHA